MPVFLTIVGLLWIVFAVVSLGNWASIIPTNIMQQVYQQNALLLFVLQVSFAVVFFAAASIIRRLGKPAAGKAPEPEVEPDSLRRMVRPVS
jgi:hypothetical protein